MKRYVLFAVGLSLFFLPWAAWAQDTSLEIISQTPSSSGTEYTVRSGGQTFSVLSRRALSEDQKARIVDIARTLYNSRYMKVRSLKMSISDGNRIDVYIIPESFIYKGVNLVPYMPSGMQFYDDEAFEYDFRMNVQKVFVRIKGRLLDEESLAEKMYSAYTDPIRFVKMQDTDYINKRIEELAFQFTEFTSNYTAQTEQLSSEVSQLKTENEGLETELSRLKKRDDELSRAALTLGNRSFFGKTKPIPEETVIQVVGMKSGDASLTPEKATETLKAHGLQTSLKEVKLIFAVYFNEF